ncbi:MAG: maleylpyruvate isomerase family mycothiol-dependent enzyme [Acidimicrobiales bacterium]|nr:maleylpyruvate isomerase family mycothiol-dependent enzyme [Acidimicrobiales bacterium]
MQLNPRYGDDPVLVLDGAPDAIAAPAIRQRRRLVAALSELSDEQWARPSRCAGWSARDVIVHLDSTNSFWAFSVALGLQGTPSEFLATFDPVASPAELVAGAAGSPPADVLAAFATSTDALVEQWAALREDEWTRTAESPPGHVSVSAVVHHALWDSWVHERDVLLPLGIEPEVEADEVAACLRYAAALAPGLAVTRGEGRRGVLRIEATAPDIVVEVVVDGSVQVRTGAPDDAGDLVLRGDAVALTEALSTRVPLGHDLAPEAAWLVSGLAETFEVDPL